MKRFALVLLFTGLAHAQMSSGSLVGDVTDQHAKPLAGVQIRAVEANTGFSRTATTAANGSYVLEDLRPGAYSVTAYKQGYRTASLSSAQVPLNQKGRLDFQLEPGR